jgi:hypothetical protein
MKNAIVIKLDVDNEVVVSFRLIVGSTKTNKIVGVQEMVA